MTGKIPDAAISLSDTPAGRAVLAVVEERFCTDDTGHEIDEAVNATLRTIAYALGVRPVVRGGKVEFEAL
jgi:hypothetical protein